MSLLLLSLIVLVAFTGLGALFFRLQKDLNGCVSKVDARTGGKFQAEPAHEFYNAFADRAPKGARTVLQREAA